MNKLTKFHIEHDYYVKIKPLPKMIGCYATFPANILQQISGANRTYIVNDDGNIVEVYHLEEGREIVSHRIAIDRFSVRTLILQDILLRTLARSMSQTLVVIEDSEPSKNIFDILHVPMDEEEQALEKELCLKFRELLLGKANNDVSGKLLHSYEMLVSCFEKGGL